MPGCYHRPKIIVNNRPDPFYLTPLTLNVALPLGTMPSSTTPSSSTSLTFYGGAGEIGGNKILLQTPHSKVYLDFGDRKKG